MRLPKGKLLALVALVLAASMVMATGAFSSVTADRSVDVKVVGDKNAFLSINDANHGGNTEYADMKNKKLVVNLDKDAKGVKGHGVNPDAKTSFDHLFTISNHGSQNVKLWIEDQSDAVTFYIKGNPKKSIEKKNGYTLKKGKMVHIGIMVDTTGSVKAPKMLNKAITIHAVAPDSGEAPGGKGKPKDPS